MALDPNNVTVRDFRADLVECHEHLREEMLTLPWGQESADENIAMVATRLEQCRSVLSELRESESMLSLFARIISDMKRERRLAESLRRELEEAESSRW